MQNVILFICLTLGVYFTGNFDSKMAQDSRHNERHMKVGNTIFDFSDI